MRIRRDVQAVHRNHHRRTSLYLLRIMSRSIMQALPRANQTVAEALQAMRDAENLVKHAELSVMSANRHKREHLLGYVDEARRAVQSALFQVSILKAEIAHLSVEDA
jgi:hypothetical protein